MLELFSAEGVKQFCATDIFCPKEKNIRIVRNNLLKECLIIVVILLLLVFIIQLKIVEPANLKN